jgi:hypothetical protein
VAATVAAAQDTIRVFAQPRGQGNGAEDTLNRMLAMTGWDFFAALLGSAR